MSISGPSGFCVPRAGEPGGVCSGRGYCVARNTSLVDTVIASCQCEEGWSAVGDLATDASVDCGIHILTYRILWGICAAFHLPMLLVAITKLCGIDRSKPKSQTVLAYSLFGFSSLHCTAFIAVGLLHASSPPQASAIGISLVSTILFAFGAAAFLCTASVFDWNVSKLALSQARLTVRESQPIRERNLHILNVLIVLCTFGGILGGFIVFGFFGGQPELDQVYGSLHYVLYCLPASKLFASSELVFVPLLAHIKGAALDRDSYANTIAMFEKNIRQFRANATIQILVNVLMAAVPLLTRKASYQLPIAWSIIALGTLDSLHRFGRKVSTSSDRSVSKSKKQRSSKALSQSPVQAVIIEQSQYGAVTA